jgi:Flp pilus assembly protein TadD
LAWSGRFTEAIFHFHESERLRELNKLPLEATPYSELAKCEFQVGNISEAYKSINKAIELDPNNPEFHTVLQQLRNVTPQH